MKLGDFLKTIPDDAEIAIGIASGYVYLGTAAHFSEVEDRISTELLEELINSKANAKKDVLYICKHGVTPKKESRTDSKGNYIPAETVEEYVKRINKTASRLKASYSRISMMTDSINCFENLMLREVLSTKEKPIYGGLQILIDGIEKGKFWTKEEYDEFEETGKLPNGYEEG